VVEEESPLSSNGNTSLPNILIASLFIIAVFSMGSDLTFGGGRNAIKGWFSILKNGVEEILETLSKESVDK